MDRMRRGGSGRRGARRPGGSPLRASRRRSLLALLPVLLLGCPALLLAGCSDRAQPAAATRGGETSAAAAPTSAPPAPPGAEHDVMAENPALSFRALLAAVPGATPARLASMEPQIQRFERCLGDSGDAGTCADPLLAATDRFQRELCDEVSADCVAHFIVLGNTAQSFGRDPAPYRAEALQRCELPSASADLCQRLRDGEL